MKWQNIFFLFLLGLVFQGCKTDHTNDAWEIEMSYKNDTERSVHNFLTRVKNGDKLENFVKLNSKDKIIPDLITIKLNNSDTFFSREKFADSILSYMHIFNNANYGNEAIKENEAQIKKDLFENIKEIDFKKLDTIYFDNSEDSINATFNFKNKAFEKRIVITNSNNSSYKQIPKELMQLFYRIKVAIMVTKGIETVRNF
jgi:hypothetical protein